MPDYQKTIIVNYNADSSPPITFSPGGGDVEMDESGEIIFRKGANSNSFTFAGITITPTSPDFSLASLTDDVMTVSDTDADPGTYSYSVSLDTDAGRVSSDPQIINKPE